MNTTPEPDEVKSSILQSVRTYLDSLEEAGAEALSANIDLYTKNTPLTSEALSAGTAEQRAAARSELISGASGDTV